MLTANDLHKAWDRSGRFLSPHSRMRLTQEGLTLGADTIIVPLGRDEWERPILKIDGNEEHILALLSIAHDQPILPKVLGNLRNASRCLCKGELALAYIHLAFTGLQPLEDPDAPRRLFMGKLLLDNGMDEIEMLKGLGLFPSYFTPWSWRQLVKEFNPDQPRVPAGCSDGGQFCSGSAVGIMPPSPHGSAPPTSRINSEMPPKLPTGSSVSSQTAADTQGRSAASSSADTNSVTRPNGASVTHQPGGDWVVSNYEQVTAIASDPAGGYYGQCVALVKQLTGMPATKDWREGDAITGYDDPPLQPGTVIATMDANGRYPQGNVPKHAAVFVKYEMRGGQAGIVIYDQYKNKDGTIKHPGPRWIAFTGNKKHPQNDAGAYSVVTVR